MRPRDHHAVDDGATPSPQRRRYDAEIVFNRVLCREHWLLRLRIIGDLAPTMPGQFVQLGCRSPKAETWIGNESSAPIGAWPQLHQPELCGSVALLRRPFSIAERGEDDGGDWIEVIHRVVGVGTDWLAHLEAGESVDLIGPLGNHFDVPPQRDLGLLVGGGVGLPPMIYLARRLVAEGWDAVAFVAARSADLLALTMEGQTPSGEGRSTMCAREFTRHRVGAVVMTDDGSLGAKGLLGEGVERYLETLDADDRRRAVVFTCGPEPMMRGVASLASRFGTDCQVCLEQAMACGMGTCQSCVVKIESDPASAHGKADNDRPWRYRLACTDGPVFDARQVVW